jgi:hypothetical protein
VKRWVGRYKATKSLVDRARSGRKRAINDSDLEEVYNLLMSNDYGGAEGVAKRLAVLGITSKVHHRTTITRAAKEVAKRKGVKIQAVRGKPKKLLPAITLKKRLTFSLAQLRTGWSNVMFTDRKKFHFTYPGTKVTPSSWVQKGQERRAYTVNHASCVNVYAGVTKYGLTSMHVVAGTTGHKCLYLNKKGASARNITSAEYKDVLTKTLLPEGRRIFANQGITKWVFQQDNDPTHRVATSVIAEYNKNNSCSISVLPAWPPSSPDLSLIENVWAYLQARMNAKGCKTFAEFKLELSKEAKAVSQQYTSNLFAGMKRRLQDCIKNQGGLTKH